MHSHNQATRRCNLSGLAVSPDRRVPLIRNGLSAFVEQVVNINCFCNRRHGYSYLQYSKLGKRAQIYNVPLEVSLFCCETNPSFRRSRRACQKLELLLNGDCNGLRPLEFSSSFCSLALPIVIEYQCKTPAKYSV